MTSDDSRLATAISELANALQVAVPTAARMRQRLDEQAEDAERLEAAIERATRAVRELQPKGGRP